MRSRHGVKCYSNVLPESAAAPGERWLAESPHHATARLQRRARGNNLNLVLTPMKGGGRSSHHCGGQVDVDLSATNSEVLSDGLSPTAYERAAEFLSRAWVGRHRVVATRALVALGMCAGLAATAFALRPAVVKPLPHVPVTGVSIVVPPPTLGSAAEGPIVATYRVGPLRSGLRVAITGVVGPLVTVSSARAFAGSAARGGVFTVSAIPDCGSASSLDATKAPYLVAVTSISSHGRLVSRHVRVPSSPVDWAAAVSQDCWQRSAAKGVVVERLGAGPDPGSGQLALTVTLRSALPSDVRVRVIDVADVATLAAADSGILRAGADRAYHVRWPIAGCSVPSLPRSNISPGVSSGGDIDSPALAWSIGPTGADPAALFVTVLSPSQLVIIREAVQRLCEPPSTSLRVTSSHVLPPDPVVVDHSGVSIAVRLALVSPAPRIVIGQNQEALTADARVQVTPAYVRLIHHKASATIVWRARCRPSEPVPPLLPVSLGAPGHFVNYSVTLDDAKLAVTYADACGLGDPKRLRMAGWDVPN
jgi:hypothetical protein